VDDGLIDAGRFEARDQGRKGAALQKQGTGGDQERDEDEQ
jgi:hypothetical protein